MPYNFAADSFQTKKLCSRLSSSEMHFLIKIDLVATYDDPLRLIGKRVVDFLLALIELFSLGDTAEELRAIIGWKSAISFQRGSADPKFHALPLPTILLLRKLNCSFVWYKNLDRSYFHFVRDHACDRQTDRRTDGRTDGQNSHR